MRLHGCMCGYHACISLQKVHVQSQVHNDAKNMVELMLYYACLISAPCKEKCGHGDETAHNFTPSFNIRNSMLTFQFSPLLSEQRSKTCWLPPSPTCQLPDSHNGEESSATDLWVPSRSRHCVGLPDCLWFQFHIIQVGKGSKQQQHLLRMFWLFDIQHMSHSRGIY